MKRIKSHQNIIKSLLLKESCEFTHFKFNMPYAYHTGGGWERQIRTVRRILSSLLNSLSTHLDDESLRPFLCAGIINSRPLTVENLSDSPISPSHLMTTKSSIIMPPPGNFENEGGYAKKRWRRVQFPANEFWAWWRKEFLQTLQARSKWHKAIRNVSLGDIVLLNDDMVPRCHWSLCEGVTRNY